MMVLTIVLKMFDGTDFPIQVEKLTDMETCLEDIKDFDPITMNMMGNVISVNAECIPLTEYEYEGIIGSYYIERLQENLCEKLSKPEFRFQARDLGL